MSYDLFLNLLLGGRGVGKTTGLNIQSTTNYFKDGSQFIYLRRYKNEIKQFTKKNTLNQVFDGYMYKGDGIGGYSYHIQDDIAGFGIPLSLAPEYKSTAFPRVTTIIYDEAILHRGGNIRYLDDEVVCFLEFVSTVFRTRKNCKVFILGNNLDMFNPYNEFFKIPIFDRIYTDRERGIYEEKIKDSEALRKKEEETPLFKLINGTQYGDYHYNNKIIDSAIATIGAKPSNVSLICRARVTDETVNIYTFQKDNDINLYFERRYKVIDDDMTYNLINGTEINYLDSKNFNLKILPFILKYYYKGKCLYSDQRSADLIKYVIDM